MSLAAAARFETSERARVYPAKVRAGRIGRDEAEDDLNAWNAIALAFERGGPDWQPVITRLGSFDGWPAIRAALDRACANREAACARSPGDAALAARRDAVRAIAALVGPRADFFIEVTAALHARARLQAAA